MAGEEIVFWAGGIIFVITTLMFLCLKSKNPKKKSIASINLIVNCITITSYALMVSGFGAIIATNGEMIYWTRWLFYAGSCSLLMLEVGILLKKSKTDITEMIISNVMVMINGALASLTIGASKWLFFIISSGSYAYVLYLINKKGVKDTKFTKKVKFYINVFWTGFPIVWILSPADLMLINAYLTAMLYLVLDLITKVLFGYCTVKNS